MEEKPKQRGIWAELYVRDFLALPFVSEFVFRSLQALDAGTQKEVADFLIAHESIGAFPGVGILMSQKTQHDPLARDAAKTLSWALKEAKKAASQLRGALRAGRGKPIWCDHPRRGSVGLPQGLPEINHGIVLLEVLERVDLNEQANNLPLQYEGTPITYLSIRDFLNIAVELRTAPDVLAYLDARRGLPYTDLRVIGDEQALFEFYLLNGGSLAGCAGKADAAIAVAARRDELDRALNSKWEDDQYSGLLEHVADQLATRRQDYAAGLSAEALAAYDAPENRSNYLKMQAVLASLGLRERSKLGRAFQGAIEKRGSENGFNYGALHFDSKPEWVFVFGSCAGIEPAQLNERMQILMLAAMAFYRKTHCLIIIDRERAGYEVGLAIRPSPPSSPTERALGDRRFAHLRITDAELTLVPD